EKCFVSIQSIELRAYYLGLLTETQNRYFWESINKKGYRRKEPLDEEIKLSKPVKINSLLDFYFKEKVMTPEFLLNDLKVSPKFLNEIANIDTRLIDKYMDVESDKERNVISHLFK
ncbi:zinc peptidase, partial [Mammaliicoccus sciuri]